jgi:hypothetical protein
VDRRGTISVLRVSDFVQIDERQGDGFCCSVAGLLHMLGSIPIWNMVAWSIERLKAQARPF